MSRIAVITYGEVAPHVGLRAALRAAVHEVTVASQAPHRGHGVAC
jgi:hypothetical protein